MWLNLIGYSYSSEREDVINNSLIGISTLSQSTLPELTHEIINQ